VRRAIFLDRDGVLNADHGYVYRVEDFQWIPGALEAVSALQAASFVPIVITNQAGIARGYYTENDFFVLTAHMKTEMQRYRIDAAVYYCPHHPDGVIAAFARECDCRKPRNGMLLRAAKELDIDLTRSLLVGDKRSDILAGRSARLQACVLVRSGHTVTEQDIALADACTADLRSAVELICERWG
jgi:D-glycero-D-manno-heptose 1,7-bisphosphate phosphatase